MPTLRAEAPELLKSLLLTYRFTGIVIFVFNQQGDEFQGYLSASYQQGAAGHGQCSLPYAGCHDAAGQ